MEMLILLTVLAIALLVVGGLPAGGGPNDITTAMKNTYAQNVYHLAQQKKSKLRMAVDVRTGVFGEKHFVDQFEARDPVKIEDRNGDSPLRKQGFDRRLITFSEFEDGDIIDKPDIWKTIDNPTNPISVAMQRGFGRKIDDEVIVALGGSAFSGKDGGTDVPLPTSQKVAVDFTYAGGGSDSNLTVEKIRRTQEILESNDVDDDDPRFFVAHPNQKAALLGSTLVSSVDFNPVFALVSGKVNEYLGFRFIWTTRTVKTGDNRQTFGFVKSGLRLLMARDPKSHIDPMRSDKRFNVYVYFMMSLGATRMEELKVVEVTCDETAA